MVNWWKSSIEEQGGEQAGALVSNLNLLINWYFLNPINQRGQTEYTAVGYTFDRWYFNGTGKVSFENGIKLIPDKDKNVYFLQKIESPEQYVGKKLTFSILYGDGQLASVSGTVGTVNNNTWTGTSFTSIKLSEHSISTTVYTNSSNGLFVQIGADGELPVITAVKLELGTVQTLARREGDTWVLNDPPPNKALELAKCQRYFRRIKSPNTDTNICAAIGFCSTATNIVVPLSLGTELRTRPTVSYSSLNDIQFQVNNAAKTVNPTNVTVIYPVGDVIDLHFTVPNVDIGPAIMRIVNAGYIDLDANL